ncbi:MAG: hypothetical protein ACYCUI_15265 [Vulcanimicrobiaceae bacterium]
MTPEDELDISRIKKEIVSASVELITLMYSNNVACELFTKGVQFFYDDLPEEQYIIEHSEEVAHIARSSLAITQIFMEEMGKMREGK